MTGFLQHKPILAFVVDQSSIHYSIVILGVTNGHLLICDWALIL